MQTQGRLADPKEFGNITVKTTGNAVVRLRDVAQVELAAQDYGSNSYLDRYPAVALAIFQRPGSNALGDRECHPQHHAAIGAAFPVRHQVRHRL